MIHSVNFVTTRDRLAVVVAIMIFFIATIVTSIIIVASSLGHVANRLNPSLYDDGVEYVDRM
jgi:hypothetical protein